MTAQADGVIFDIGNVLVRWDPRFLYDSLIDDPVELDWFLCEVVPLSWHTRHDRGESFADTIPERQRQFPDYAHLIALFRDRWEDTIGDPIGGNVALLEHLDDAGIPVFALTNYSAETFPGFTRRFPFARRFRDVVVSGQEGMVKPDPRIYDLALERFGLTAKRAVFIDDRRENVAAARERGMIGLHYTPTSDLRRALATLGLLV